MDITITCLIERDWNSAWMYSTTAALSFIVILLIDKERKRKENTRIRE
jgi:uncharacterized membrane protein YsdA (DUF1294 family)